MFRGVVSDEFIPAWTVRESAKSLQIDVAPQLVRQEPAQRAGSTRRFNSAAIRLYNAMICYKYIWDMGLTWIVWKSLNLNCLKIVNPPKIHWFKAPKFSLLMAITWGSPGPSWWHNDTGAFLQHLCRLLLSNVPSSCLPKNQFPHQI